jgi:hypothetical protein
VLNPGDTIGDWQIVLPLGRGGMGAVYRCRHALSQRIEAAVKVLEPTPLSGARERFIREAEALHALRHPAIVGISGFGEDARTGLLFLAMELVGGEDFDRLLQRGAFPRERVGEIFASLADGLAYAHRRGVAHRDLKPANLMLRGDGSPVLVDFGIAVQEGRDRLTQEGVVPGTVAYAAPEQVTAAGRHDAAMADVYALGQVMCECLTGSFTFPRPPDVDDHRRSIQILRAKLKIQALDPGHEAPPRLRELVRTATAPDPGRRGPPLDRWGRILAGGVADEPEESATALLAAPARGPRSEPILPLDLALPTGDDLVLGAPDADLGTGDGSRTGTAVRRRRAVGVAALSATLVVAAGAAVVVAALVVGAALVWGGLRDDGAVAWTLDEAPEAHEGFPLGDILEAPDLELAELEAEAERREIRPQVPSPAPTGAARGAPRAPVGEARLVVAADVPAAVWVDGAYVRDSPTVLRLPAGAYGIELRPADGAPRAFRVSLEPGESVRRIWSFPQGEWRSFDGGVDPVGLPSRPPVGDAESRMNASPATRACLAQASVGEPLPFTLAIVPDGTVVADGLTGDLRGSPLDECLKGAARALTFRPSVLGAGVTVRVKP